MSLVYCVFIYDGPEEYLDLCTKFDQSGFSLVHLPVEACIGWEANLLKKRAEQEKRVFDHEKRAAEEGKRAAEEEAATQKKRADADALTILDLQNQVASLQRN